MDMGRPSTVTDAEIGDGRRASALSFLDSPLRDARLPGVQSLELELRMFVWYSFMGMSFIQRWISISIMICNYHATR